MNTHEKNLRVPLSSLFVKVILLLIFTITIHSTVAPDENLRRYNYRWGPAVAAACFGKLGILNLDNVEKAEAIAAQKKYEEFLDGINSIPFTCDDIPERARLLSFQEGAHANLRGFLRNQVGLHFLSGYLFRMFGFNWEIVGVLASLFGGLVVLGLFIIANQFVKTLPALGIAVISSLATPNLELVPIIRDYAKTSFIIFGFLVLVQIVAQTETSARKFYIRCALLGLLLGVGLMFRTDLLATFVLTLAILFFFPFKNDHPSQRPHNKLLATFAAPLAITLPFLAFYIPSNIVFAIEYDAIGHVLNLGLSERSLTNARWAFHDVIFNPLYRDYSSYGMIGAYGAATGVENVIAVTAGYAQASMQLFRETLKVFPFDLLGRCFGIFFDIALAGIIYPFEVGKSAFMYTMAAASLFFYVYAFINYRRLFYFALFYFFGYSCVVSMQYIERHYFFLHMLWFVFVWANVVCFAGHWAGQNSRIARFFVAQRYPNPPVGVNWKIQSLFFALIAVVMVTVFVLQNTRETAWKKTVLAQSVLPVQAVIIPEGLVPGSPAPTSTENAHVIQLSAPWSDFSGAVLPNLDYSQTSLNAPIGGYLEVRFKSSTICKQAAGRFWVMYTARSYAWDLSHVVNVTMDETHSTSHFLPVFFSEPSKFSRLTFNVAGSNCLEGLYWVKGFQNIRLPIAFTISRSG